MQAALYAGFSAAEETLALAAEVFSERGLPFPPDPPEDASLEELVRRGTELMGALHGDRARLGYAAPDNPITGALYPTAIQYGYGEIWFRPGLERRQRALVAVAAFTALRLPRSRSLRGGGLCPGNRPAHPIWRRPEAKPFTRILAAWRELKRGSTEKGAKLPRICPR